MREPKHPARARGERDLIATAGRIVQDATEVDWSREPATEYEAAIRAEYLSTGLLTFGGRSEIMHLSFTLERNMATDLEAASEKALEIIAAHVAQGERDSLAKARRAVDARRPK